MQCTPASHAKLVSDFLACLDEVTSTIQHGHLELRVRNRKYDCAIDIDSDRRLNGHKWSTFSLDDSDFAAVRSLSSGWHNLRSNGTSGTPNYLPSPDIASKISRTAGDSIQAVEALEDFLARGKGYFVFGEPSTSRDGIHNVHQNQGSEIDSGHDAENGIWQDDAVLIEKDDGLLVA